MARGAWTAAPSTGKTPAKVAKVSITERSGSSRDDSSREAGYPHRATCLHNGSRRPLDKGKARRDEKSAI